MTPETHHAIGLAMALCGQGLHLWGRRTLHRVGVRGWAFAMPEPPPLWTRRGPYRLLRHPCYVGALLVIAGVGVFALGWGGAALAFAAWPFYAQRIYVEETYRRG